MKEQRGLKKNHIVEGENPKKPSCIASITIGIELKGNKACQGSNKSTKTAEIYPNQQGRIIIGEAGKQDDSRHVTDNLAGTNTHQNFMVDQKL